MKLDLRKLLEAFLTSQNESQVTIEDSLIKIIKGASNIDQLIYCWKTCKHLYPALGEPITERVLQILETISDMFQLQYYHYIGAPGLKKDVERRMAEILAGVSSDDVPRWFLIMLGCKELIPDFLVDKFKAKVSDLHKQTSE